MQATNPKTPPINNRQKKIIHTIIHALGMDDASYRGLLRKWYEVDTCTSLNYAQADDMIQKLQYIAGKVGKWVSRDGMRTKFDSLGHRPGMASPRQLRMIDAMWKDVSFQEDDEAKERALNTFLFNFFRISHVRFLESWQARKIIRALEAMKEAEARHEESRHDRRGLQTSQRRNGR